MSNKSTNNGVGVGFILFLVFLVLKLTDNIDWSWWYVTMPLWIAPAIAIVVGTLWFLVACVIESTKKKK